MSGNVVHCGAKHDRDENAARNILVAGGPTETKNGQGGQHKTTAKVAAACEMSTRIGATARLLPGAFRPGRMSIMKSNHIINFIRTYATALILVVIS